MRAVRRGDVRGSQPARVLGSVAALGWLVPPARAKALRLVAHCTHAQQQATS